MTIRCRFAPSPTGVLHVGGARTALFNLLFARSTGGRFVLRIEDTDQVRSSRRSEDSIKADLRWLGLDWVEGPEEGGPGAPYRQSERLDIYARHTADLLAAGHAYEAWESSEELEALRAEAAATKATFKYRQRSYSAEEIARFKAEGRRPVIRLRVPDHDWSFTDLILGPVTVPADDMDDFVLVKTDGFPTYHYAVVIDDHHMEVTHVLRAQEHLMNTAKHLALYERFGWTPPEHGHMPLIFSMDGGKMSKRDKAKAARAKAEELKVDPIGAAALVGMEPELVQAFLEKRSDEVAIAVALGEALGAELPEIDVVDFRKGGYLPEALVNFLALQGWSPAEEHANREIWSIDELVGVFSLDKVGKTAARFDRAKLKWMNGQYIRASSPERLVRAIRDYARDVKTPLAGLDDGTLTALVKLYHERLTTLKELDQASRFFFHAPTTWNPEDKAIKKVMPKGLEALTACREALGALKDWTEAEIEAAGTELANARFNGKLGELAQPLRVAVSGGTVSPPIWGTLAVLGREQTLERIDRCLGFFGG